MRNTKKSRNNKSGVNGVWYNERRNEFHAFIYDRSIKKHIGVYKSLEEAGAARKEAERNFGYHENHGRD